MAFGTFKQDLETKQVKYTKKRVDRPYTWSEGFSGGASVGVITHTVYQVYEYHRYCTKRYKYVGMNQTMAENKLKSLINTYNRTVYISQWNDSGANAGEFTDITAGNKLQASIYAQRVAGCLYEVIVEINEDDTKFDTHGYVSPESLFSKENARGYDA